MVLEMEVSLTPQVQIPFLLTNSYSRWTLSTPRAQGMESRHICLCCSNTLLRHIRLGGLYWRCSHCYEEMPV